MDDLLGNTAETFFGNISSVPKVFLMGTLWLHNQDHLKCTENSLPQENCIKISLENLQCSCSVRGGTLQLHCPFTYSVLAVFQLWTLVHAPSERGTDLSACNFHGFKF